MGSAADSIPDVAGCRGTHPSHLNSKAEESKDLQRYTSVALCMGGCHPLSGLQRSRLY